MSLTIHLTEKIRELPYFSSFQEEEVDVPDKPFLREILYHFLRIESLSIEELQQCIETSIYFNLDTTQLIQELLWKIGADKDTFSSWFIQKEENWTLRGGLSVLIEKELSGAIGKVINRARLIRLGIRCLESNCVEIIIEGNLRLLKWIYSISRDKCFDNKRLCVIAATYGHLDCLKYLHEHVYPWEQTTVTAMINGRLDYFKCSHEQDCLRGDCTICHLYNEWTSDVGYFHYREWPEWITFCAASGGHLNCLKYLHEHNYSSDTRTTARAARNGQLECLKYLHEQDCPWDWPVTSEAAGNGQLECLRYLHEQGCPWTALTISSAANNGHLDCIRYAHERGCIWDVVATANAAGNGQLECLRYLHEQGCPWDIDVIDMAAENGHLDCLRYLHEQGCPWNRETAISAAQYGRLDCLKYLHEQGCPWNREIIRCAIENGQVECLEYLYKQGYPWNIWTGYYTIKIYVQGLAAIFLGSAYRM